MAQTFYVMVKWVFLKITLAIVLPRSSCCQYLEVPATILILQFNLVSQRKGELKDQGKNESLNTGPLISIGSMETAKTVGMIKGPFCKILTSKLRLSKRLTSQ